MVQRYRLFKDRLRLAAAPHKLGKEPTGLHCFFWCEMPASWSKKKKEQMSNTPMRQKPDGDNLLKAVADGLFAEDDCMIWSWSARKWWSEGAGRIEITVEYADE